MSKEIERVFIEVLDDIYDLATKIKARIIALDDAEPGPLDPSLRIKILFEYSTHYELREIHSMIFGHNDKNILYYHKLYEDYIEIKLDSRFNVK